MKIGLWLQDYTKCSEKVFNDVLEIVKKSDIDIFVFPEASYTPFSDLIRKNDLFSRESHLYFEKAKEMATTIGKPTVFSDCDMYGTMFSYYYNPIAEEGETVEKDYVKHTATNCSAFDLENYDDFWAYHNFEPILLKGHKIGLTICYDCNHAIFSRAYAYEGVDIIINSTGGNIVHDKWFKYNQVRAIENDCYTFVTMGYCKSKKVNSWVFGFGPNGNPLPYTNLMCNNPTETNLVGTVYVYDTEADDHSYYKDVSNLYSTQNKYEDLFIEAGNVEKYLKKSEKIEDGLFVYSYKENNIVFVVLYEDDIKCPEIVLYMLYHPELKKYDNKKYVIVNVWDKLDEDYFKTQLSPILKVRSMENYCAVILESDIRNKCYQCGNNRTSQVIQEINGKFGLDLNRMGGPETIWKNKPGKMKASWREHYEKLVYSFCEETEE